MTPIIRGAGQVFSPVACTKLNVATDWQRNTSVTLTGRTITQNQGPLNPRVTFEGVMLETQRQTLEAIKDATNEVELVSDAYTGPVTFDTMDITHKDEEDTANATIDGRDTTQPVYTFQLQSKEQDNEGVASSLFS